MNAKNLINLENNFNYQDFYKSGFVWHRDEAVAFIQNRHTVQLLLPKKYLLRYPQYSASFNGFIEIPSGIVWFAPQLVAEIVRVWCHRFFNAPLAEDKVDQVRTKLELFFGFHTGYPDLHQKIHNPAAKIKTCILAEQPLGDSFLEISRSSKCLYSSIYELTPLWSNHVRRSDDESGMRTALLRVPYQDKLLSVLTSKALVLNEGLANCCTPSTLLGFCVKKLNLLGDFLDYWFIPSYKIGYDSLSSQSITYVVNYEMGQKLSTLEDGQVRATEVDRKLDDIAWSKDTSLTSEELEKIAIVMAQMDSKEFTLHYQNHILQDLLVNDLSLDDGIQAIEKLSAGKHSRANVDSKLFKEACLNRAVEIQGADAGLPLSRYFH